MILHCPIEELVTIIKSHISHPENVQAIMLHGSRADGRAHNSSDYDIVIIQDPCISNQVKFIHDEIPYSCHCFSPGIATAKNMTSQIAFFCFGLKTLFDPTGIGAEFTKAVNNHVKIASQVYPKRKDQIEKHLAYLMQVSQDIALKAKQATQENLSNQSELNIQAEKARIDCLLLSLDYMFMYHGMPDVGGKRELEVLLRDDPRLLDLFIKAILPGATYEDAYIWLEAAKQEPFKANSFNIEFDEPAKIPSLSATNRQGETYMVMHMFLSYKYNLKPKAIK